MPTFNEYEVLEKLLKEGEVWVMEDDINSYCEHFLDRVGLPLECLEVRVDIYKLTLKVKR